MAKLRAASFSISLDGFGAGVDQSLSDPMGKGGMSLHGWAFATRTFREMFGQGGGETGVDNDFAGAGFQNIGAWIVGRNMFSPERGPWGDSDWRGWWGDNPPYHCPVFVLTHHPRAPLEMEGGTTFHFVTKGLAEAVNLAKAAAKGADVRLGGGVATLREGFAEGLIDAAHLAVSPVLLGRGEALFAGLDLPALGYRVARQVSGERASHIVLERG
jgi:dihydrofolate reductase